MLKTFTAFYSLLPLRPMLSARFYKKDAGFCLIINSLKPVILWATETFFHAKTLFTARLQHCCKHVFSTFKTMTTSPLFLSFAVSLFALIDNGCAICSEWSTSVALLCWLTQACSCLRASQIPASPLLSLPRSLLSSPLSLSQHTI